MGKTAFLFAGQGAQTVGMGHDFFLELPAARRIYEMGESLSPGILHTCFEGDEGELRRTENTQPCLFLTDLAIASALTAPASEGGGGLRCDGVCGFSLGELPALAFAEVLSAADAYRLVLLRGRTMADCAAAHPGGMVAVLKLPDEAVEELCADHDGAYAVNYNCPGQVVCALREDAVEGFCEGVRARGGRAVRLPVGGAFHTPYMKPATDALRRALAGMEIDPPARPIYADLTGQPYPALREGIIDTCSAQASSPVRFATALRNMRRDGFDTFIEVGAGRALTGFVGRTLPDARVLTVTDLASFREACGALAAAR